MFEMGNLTKNLQNLIKLLKKVIKIHFYKILFRIQMWYAISVISLHTYYTIKNVKGTVIK